VTDSSTNNTALLENTNASGVSLIHLKDNNGYSYTTGMVGSSVASAVICYIKKSDLSTASMIQMYPDGIIQIGLEDLTATPNTILVIGDIFSGFCCYLMLEVKSVKYFVTYNTTSDYRLKYNVKAVDKGVEKVMKLKPVNLNFAGYGSQDGFLAHMFAEVCARKVIKMKLIKMASLVTRVWIQRLVYRY
jgi:hypothetical protein